MGLQVSFVNGICTVKGGQHVTMIADQIVQKLTAVVKKKNKVHQQDYYHPFHLQRHDRYLYAWPTTTHCAFLA